MRLSRLLAVWLASAAVLAGPARPVDAGEGHPGPAPRPSPEAAPVPLAPGDVLAVGSGDAEGFGVLVPAPPDVGGWAQAAKLVVPGVEASRWTGYLCTTGSGRFVAVTFAPVSFANRPMLRDRGAFAAIVDLRTGDRWTVPERVALKYHTPGCGVGDDVVFLRHLGEDQAATEILRVDPVRRHLTARWTVSGQLTSAVPATGGAVPGSDWVVAAAGRAIVATGPTGEVRRLAVAGGAAFDVHPAAGGGVDFMALDGSDRVTALRLELDGAMQRLAGAPLGRLRFAPGRDGHNRLVGRAEEGPGSGVALVAADSLPAAVSLDGSVVVERVDPSGPVVVSRPAAGGAAAAAPVGNSAIPVTISDVAAASEPGSGPTTEAPNVTTPRCAVPRNDDHVQVMQPAARQVEWAAHRAVRGELTNPRPPDWNHNGLGAYVPGHRFPRQGLEGGGRVPVQVLLGILAQESNLKQASYHALPGVPGNPLVADYYGVVYFGGKIIGIDYDRADCGYGIAQVTDHMTQGDTIYTPEDQKIIATDYEANMAAGVRILEGKWNQALEHGIIANGGEPEQIENWYFAIWAYNTGIHDRVGDGPYGLGWTNNPANADYPPDRRPFLRGSYDDAAHPANWPYQERVLGWAETPQRTYTGKQAYHDLNASLVLPHRTAFCEAQVNECSPDFVNPEIPTLSYCQRADRRCWWHGPMRWLTVGLPGTFEDPATYSESEPEPGTNNPHPPSCVGAQSPVPTSPELPALPADAVIVDDVPDSGTNLVGCPGRPSLGQFTFTFSTDPNGAPLSAVDFHQIGAGFGGHFWFAHTNDKERPSHIVTGTWTPPATTVGSTRIFVHIPDHGADTYQADYTITAPSGSHHRVVNQRWGANVWHDLGVFDLGSGGSVSLSNVTRSDHRLGRAIDVAWDAVAFLPAAPPVVSYVAFGDSYSAGEGVEPYHANADNGKNTPGHGNACHRSPGGYPELVYKELRLRHPGPSELHFQACSGAVMSDVVGPTERFGEVPQLDQGWLDERTTHVTISISGNDAGFGDIVRGCMLTLTDCLSRDFRLTRDGVVDPEPLVDYEPKIIAGLRLPLVGLLGEIRKRGPQAEITLVAYPRIVWSDGAGSGVGCALLSQDVTRWFKEMTDLLVTEMEAAAREAGVGFADPRRAFLNHEACSSVDEQWINAVVAYSSSGSGRKVPGTGTFHPKARGHEAYADVVLKAG